MSTCPQILNGFAMQMRAANDDPASVPCGTQGSIAGIVVAFSAERTAGRRRDPRQDNDDPHYDDLLGMVCAEMERPPA
jgi:hypothetical protein